MAVEFDATLSQRLNMKHFPFDRQILQMSFFVRTGNRGGWTVSDEAKPWNDTGYEGDVRLHPATAHVLWSLLSAFWSQCAFSDSSLLC